MTADGERAALRAIREWLEEKGELLLAELKRLDGSNDVDAIRELTERLERHRRDLLALHDALERLQLHHGRPG